MSVLIAPCGKWDVMSHTSAAIKRRLSKCARNYARDWGGTSTRPSVRLWGNVESFSASKLVKTWSSSVFFFFFLFHLPVEAKGVSIKRLSGDNSGNQVKVVYRWARQAHEKSRQAQSWGWGINFQLGVGHGAVGYFCDITSNLISTWHLQWQVLNVARACSLNSLQRSLRNCWQAGKCITRLAIQH